VEITWEEEFRAQGVIEAQPSNILLHYSKWRPQIEPKDLKQLELKSGETRGSKCNTNGQGDNNATPMDKKKVEISRQRSPAQGVVEASPCLLALLHYIPK